MGMTNMGSINFIISSLDLDIAPGKKTFNESMATLLEYVGNKVLIGCEHTPLRLLLSPLYICNRLPRVRLLRSLVYAFPLQHMDERFSRELAAVAHQHARPFPPLSLCCYD